MKTSLKKFGVLLAVTTLVVSCAKEKEYEEVYKESTFAKSAISTDPNDPYVYVPSVGATPKDVSASRSFALGDQKLVTFKFEEDKLIVEELPREDRFSGNRNNFSPVMEFDVDYKDFRCKEDQFGECANSEEEVDDVSWDRKRFVKIDFSSMEKLETNTLPLELENLFIGCYGEGKTVVRKAKVEDGAINIHVQKTWNANILCAELETFADLRNLSFTVDYYYSFVKLSKLAGKDYEPVKYPFEDQNSFGYFTTDVTKLTADNRTTIDSKVTYLNRWDPKRKEIKYYLNDEFYKEGMESVLESTKQAIQTINNSFEHAGMDTKIVLEDGRGVDMGDIRNNFIILISDPQASGVIGYGPSIANPRTGEILKAHTVMYYGTIRKFIQDTYDELLEENEREAVKAENAEVASKVPAIEGKPLDEVEASRIQTNRELLTRFSSHLSKPTQRRVNVSMSQVSRDLSKEMFNPARKLELSHWLKKLQDAKNLPATEVAKARLNEMSHRCFYHASMVNWHDTLAGGISAEALGIDELKPWNDLSEEDKEKVITKLLPNVWVPTLVHEFGHNLGLRHNFNGSEDKENYYTAEERRSLGINRDVTYSSVMDYSYSSLNQLPVMGKYDIAALRFAYKREVEKKDGVRYALKNDETLELIDKRNEEIRKRRNAGKPETEEQAKEEILNLKSYQFCTDEHVEVNPGCNRFDEGAGLKAIAEHYVKAYKKNYLKRNFRNKRANFDSYGGDVNYYFGVEYTFEGLRRFFEIYDRLTVKYPWSATANWDDLIANAPNDEVRENIRSNKEFFVSLKDAASVAADFYLDVLTTPEVHCMVSNKNTNEVIATVPMKQIASEESESCYSSEVTDNLAEINKDFVVTGQGGKFFNNMRFDSTLPGELNADPTQISVRGIWADKLLAVEYLTKRVLGISTFDDVRNNFLDYPLFAEKIQKTFTAFLMDNIEKEVEIEMADGKVSKIPLVFNIGKTHEIQRSFHPGLNRYLGMNKVRTDFRELMLARIKKELGGIEDNFEDRWVTYDAYDVTAVGLTSNINRNLVAKEAIFKDKNGAVISHFIAQDSNTIAKELMAQREERQSIEALDQNLVKVAYVVISAEIELANLPKTVAQMYALPVATLEQAVGNMRGLQKTLVEAIIGIRKANPAATAAELPALIAPVIEVGAEKIVNFVDGGYLADDHLLRMFMFM